MRRPRWRRRSCPWARSRSSPASSTGRRGSGRFARYLAPALHRAAAAGGERALSGGAELLFSAAAAVPALLGFLLAWAWYGRASGGAAAFARTHALAYRVLSAKWYVDEIY